MGYTSTNGLVVAVVPKRAEHHENPRAQVSNGEVPLVYSVADVTHATFLSTCPRWASGALLAGALVLAACTGPTDANAGGTAEGDQGDSPAQPEQTTTSAAQTPQPTVTAPPFTSLRESFGQPLPNLPQEQLRAFLRGDLFFGQDFAAAPGASDSRDGLGPTFNAQSCSACHVLDGRGAPPQAIGAVQQRGAGGAGLLLRLSVPGEDPVTGGPLPDPIYGTQLQDRALPGVPAEGQIELSYDLINGTYTDGIDFQLLDPNYEIVDPAFGPLDDEVLLSPRLATQVFGMGLLEAVPEETILSLADPDDADGDGISGRPNIVWDARVGEPALGRFGWKANIATLEQQIADAFFNDMGITSSLHPGENCGADNDGLQAECLATVSGGNPELDEEILGVITTWNALLAPPENPFGGSGEGEDLFTEIGCASCHTPTLQTGPDNIDSLADRTIQPYTDLLLHDMGEGLADGRPDFDASGTEWRTPPLWGLGLHTTVNGTRFLLHDGRASTIEEAILWHGGEAEASREAFRSLDLGQREALVDFLEGL